MRLLVGLDFRTVLQQKERESSNKFGFPDQQTEGKRVKQQIWIPRPTNLRNFPFVVQLQTRGSEQEILDESENNGFEKDFLRRRISFQNYSSEQEISFVLFP
jgi:hypothetical protein